ncbi:hypothetical protein BJ165DRAFT_566194 [Panaeolus papilionaceus]|nr:hypothetical protein BJ165DRAFT_566194 [Panaeolus papilionaceus]
MTLVGSIPRSAFILSQVCHHWRAIATSHPLLWRNICVSLNTKSPSSLLKACLPRTRSADLFISITADQVDREGPDLEELQACLRLLYEASPRWKSSAFVLNDVSRRELIRVASRPTDTSSAPDLSSLEQIESRMVYRKYAADRDEYEFLDRFCNALRIAPRILCIGGWRSSELRLPSPKLVRAKPKLQAVVSLTIFRQCLGTLFPFFSSLAMMTQLMHLKFRDCECSYHPAGAIRVTLPHLEKLSIMDMSHGDDVESILNSVLLPSLVDVTFTFPLHMPSFHDMATLSNCKIRRLHMRSNHYFFNYLFHFLAAPFFTTLEDLTLDAKGGLNTQQISFLDGKPEASYFDLPYTDIHVEIPVFKEALTSLTLIGCVSQDGVLGKVARSRMRSGKLRYFYAEVGGMVSEEHPNDDKLFGELRRGGLDAHLFGSPR